jgi:hypothetical protein
MLEFRVPPNAFKAVQKKAVITSLILFSFVVLIVIILPTLMSNDPARFDTLPIIVPLLLGAAGFGIFRGLKRQRAIFESFVLKIDDEKIVREQMNTPTLTIYRIDVVSITRHSSGAFAIRGKDKLNPIGIPSQIDNYKLLEDTLSQIRPMNVLTSKTWLEKMFIPLPLSFVVLTGIIILSENETVNIICHVLIVVMLTACLILVQLSKNIDKKTRRLSWVGLIPLTAYLSVIINRILE